MKNKILIAIFFIAVTYIIGCLGSLSFDITQWDNIFREMLFGVCLFCIIVGCILDVIRKDATSHHCVNPYAGVQIYTRDEVVSLLIALAKETDSSHDRGNRTVYGFIDVNVPRIRMYENEKGR